MRNNNQIDIICSRITNPYSVDDFLSLTEIDNLVTIFENIKNEDLSKPYVDLIKKNTGPITLDLHRVKNQALIRSILTRLRVLIGDFEVTSSFYFHTDYPHVIHNDDTFELPEGVYKGVTLPLKIYGEYKDYPKLCFFDQFYFHGPAKFFKGSKDIPTYYNEQIYDYANLNGLVSETFDNELYRKYFTHMQYRWLDGLSINSIFDWKPGSAIIFDSVRLHCASDFRKLGIRSKLGISIFTKI
jgi:hypothetical protein